MDKSRRRLIQAGLLGGAAVAAGEFPQVSMAATDAKKTHRSLNILILGGTGFIGPHMVIEALRRGHKVSLFNRGRSNRTLFRDLDLYVGDRDNGLDALKGHTWDAVVDNSGYVPRHVTDSARLLSSATSHYLYVSSISAYAGFGRANDESSPLASMDDDTVEEITGETYGPLKALCEKRAAAEINAGDLTILRPTYVCGPGDHTDRFTWWPARTMRGGDMLWPGTRADRIQIIDVRDLANFVVDSLEQKITGIYNMVTPASGYTMGELHDDCLAITASDMNAVWVSGRFIDDNKLAEGRSIPIWTSPDGDSGKVAFVNGEKAVAAGLRNRPIRETARDALAWWKTLPEARTSKPNAGLSAEVEANALEQWKTQNA